MALRGAQNGNEVGMLNGLRHHYQLRGIEKSEALEKRLYEIIVVGLQQNIRTKVLLGLGTAENPRYNYTDLIHAVADIATLLDIKSGIKLNSGQ
jgi:hypothetical protein